MTITRYIVVFLFLALPAIADNAYLNVGGKSLSLGPGNMLGVDYIAPPPTKVPRWENSIVWYPNNVFTNSSGKRQDMSAVGTNNGTLAAGAASPTYVSASEGLSYDGGDSASVDVKILNGATSFTMSVWQKVIVYPTKCGSFMWRHTDPNAFGFVKATATPSPKWAWQVAWFDISDITGGGATNTWIHLCTTWSSNTGSRVYVNGILTLTLATQLKGSSITQGDVIRSGWDDYAADRYYTGRIDDELIYNVELSSNEVFQLTGFGH